MDLTHINYYLLVYSGTVAIGLLMLAIIFVSFLAATSVVAVIYGLVHATRRTVGAARRVAGAAVKSMPVVSPGPTVLRHSSRTVVVLTPRTPSTPSVPPAPNASVEQPPVLKKAVLKKAA